VLLILTVDSPSESGIIVGSALDIVQAARGVDMSSFRCVSASALLSFGTISVGGAFCFCEIFLVCDANCTS
jgi:hypothetical protein